MNRGGVSASRAHQRRGGLHARLVELERFHEAAIAAARGPSTQEVAAAARARVREILAERGVEQQATESLFDALARALGIGGSELRAYLRQRAYGACQGGETPRKFKLFNN